VAKIKMANKDDKTVDILLPKIVKLRLYIISLRYQLAICVNSTSTNNYSLEFVIFYEFILPTGEPFSVLTHSPVRRL
jgi:hypothetical protein